MNFFGLLVSVLLHGCGFVLFFVMHMVTPYEPLAPKQPSVLCTIPLEVEARSDVSTAPISKPKADKLKGSKEDRIKVQESGSITPEKEEKPTFDDAIVPDGHFPEQVKERETIEKIPEPKEIKKEPLPSEIKQKKEPSEKSKKTESNKKKKIIENVLPDSKKQSKLKEQAKKLDAKKKKESGKKDKGKTKEISAFDAISQALEKVHDPKKHKGKKNQDFVDVLDDADVDIKSGPMSQTPITDPDSESEYGAEEIGPSLSMSDIDRIRRIFHDAWQIPLRASEGGGLQIYVMLAMNRDGTVDTAKIDREKSTSRHPAYELGVESVMRVINYFKNHPLPLSPQTYDAWKKFYFRFHANQSL